MSVAEVTRKREPSKQESGACQDLDVIVVGAGQAGLALGYRLARAGVRFAILERESSAGDIWRRRYDGLTLFTPRNMSALPGLPLRGDPEGYATKDEFATYLEAYAERFGLPIHFEHDVEALDRDDAGRFRMRCTNGREFRSAAVVVATGPFQVPHIPGAASRAPALKHFAAATFSPSMLESRCRVLVVGDGASGRDVAAGMAANHDVILATGKPRRLLPQRILGRSVWWWLRAFGLLSAPPNSLLGRFMIRMDAFPQRGNSLEQLAEKGVSIRPRLITFEEDLAHFSDRSAERIDAVIWATGYRDDFSWIRLDFHSDRRTEPFPGIFLIGRPWQFGRRSALICGAAPDSNIIARQILERLRSPVDTLPAPGQGQSKPESTAFGAP